MWDDKTAGKRCAAQRVQLKWWQTSTERGSRGSWAWLNVLELWRLFLSNLSTVLHWWSRHHLSPRLPKDFLTTFLPLVLKVGCQGGGWQVKCGLLVLRSWEANTVGASVGGRRTWVKRETFQEPLGLVLCFLKGGFSSHFPTYTCWLLASTCCCFLLLELFSAEICGLNCSLPDRRCTCPVLWEA